MKSILAAITRVQDGLLWALYQRKRDLKVNKGPTLYQVQYFMFIFVGMHILKDVKVDENKG
jgi:hypothetical protein